jgi:hypothetical protein
MACARCHDHKTEPFSMEDYYALAGIFKSTQTFYGNWIDSENNNHGRLIRLPQLLGQMIVEQIDFCGACEAAQGRSGEAQRR